jgi:hypothetical protein
MRNLLGWVTVLVASVGLYRYFAPAKTPRPREAIAPAASAPIAPLPAANPSTPPAALPPPVDEDGTPITLRAQLSRAGELRTTFAPPGATDASERLQTARHLGAGSHEVALHVPPGMAASFELVEDQPRAGDRLRWQIATPVKRLVEGEAVLRPRSRQPLRLRADLLDPTTEVRR